MKLEEFWVSAAVCAVATITAYAAGAFGNASSLAALAIFAISQSGFFALQSLRKSGVSSTDSAYIFIVAIACAWGASALVSSSFSLLISLAAIPIIMCAPAVSLLVRESFSG